MTEETGGYAEVLHCTTEERQTDDLLGILRAQLGPEYLDPEVNQDPLGIFALAVPQERKIASAFFLELQRKLLLMERASRMIQIQHNVTKDQQVALSRLVTAVSRISHPFPDEDNGRYTLTKGIYAYEPHVAKGHGQKIKPEQYHYAEPANMVWSIYDAKKNQTLSLTFFPIPYGHYGKKYPELDGTSPDEAREILLTGCNRSSKILHVADIVDKAKPTYQPAHMSIRLDEGRAFFPFTDRRPVADIGGVLCRENELPGFDLRFTGAPDISTFVHIHNGRYNQQKRGTYHPHHAIELISSTLMKMDLQPSVKFSSAHVSKS
ncbi:MAG: hypothetical protein WC489_06700 [Patescibacteria group bacterium]